MRTYYRYSFKQGIQKYQEHIFENFTHAIYVYMDLSAITIYFVGWIALETVDLNILN